MSAHTLPWSVRNAKEIPVGAITEQFIDTFWQRVQVDPATGCWNWTGVIGSSGYGVLRVPGGQFNFQAHRVAYVMTTGDQIPSGKVLDHQCFNRACVNVEHLRISEHYENWHRWDPTKRVKRVQPGGTCPNGHEMTPENTYVSPRGAVNCRTCNNAATVRYYHRHKSLKSA